MNQETYGTLNLASEAIGELLELLAEHPRLDILSRAEFARRECLRLTNAALKARLATASK